MLLAEAGGRPRALVAAVAAAAIGLPRDVERDVVPLVIAALEASLAHDASVITDLACAALPDHIPKGEGAHAHALRRRGCEALHCFLCDE